MIEYVKINSNTDEVLYSNMPALLSELTGKTENHKETIAQIKKIAENPNYVIFMAIENGTAVGTAMGIICENLLESYSPFMVVEDVVVAKSHRRQGLARQLMLKLETFAAEKNCRYITLASQDKRKDAHALYLSLGYTEDKAFQKFEI